MSAPPYMKLYVADYLGDTHHLGALEHGAYLLLLMAMWRAGGSIPAADGNLARMARCTPEQWAEIRDVVLAYFKRSRGKLTQKRLADEMAKYENTSGKRSEAGKLGAAKKASKNKAPTLSIAYVDDKQLPTYPEPEPESEPEREGGGGDAREVADDWPEGGAQDHAKLLVEASASPWLDPQKTHGLITTAGRLVGWRKRGASWTQDVLPVVTSLAGAHGERISSWQFFEAAIGRSVAAGRQSLDVPSTVVSLRATGPPSYAAQNAADIAEVRRRLLES